MKLDFIPLSQLSVSTSNMRHSKKSPDVSDLLPSVRKRGVLVPVLVRPNCLPDTFEIIAGARRFAAAQVIAEEQRENGGGASEPMPCAILDDGDDADAIEASLLENVARLDADEVTRWETFTRLVREGRNIEDISATFGIPELGVKRVLTLGNLLPRIRRLYASGKLDATTVRHLTLASKSQQHVWLGLFADPDTYCPTGHQLKAWLLGGQSIKVEHALFDLDDFSGSIVADLFGEDRYFADADAFWTAQEAAIEARRAAYLEEGWADALILPRGEYFHSWEYRKTPKRKGGRIYIHIHNSGEVTFHEGYLTDKEAKRFEQGQPVEGTAKPKRPELTGPLQAYVDLHRHAAVRAALVGRPDVALRLMAAHAIAGSLLWSVRVEPQTARSDDIRESVETCKSEAQFDAARRSILAVLGFSPDDPTVIGGSSGAYGGDTLTAVFLRLLDLPKAAVMDVIAVVMGESLAAGSAVIEAVGPEVGVDMRSAWAADHTFFALLRDREVLAAILAEVAGEQVAEANTKEKGKTVKGIVRDCLDGANGREKVGPWVPRWMAFPPSSYTARGGVGTVKAAALVAEARDSLAPATDGAEPAPASAEQADPDSLEPAEALAA